MRRRLIELGGPVALLALAGLIGSFVSNARAIEFENALVFAAMVTAIYVFVGNSGVLSFGQIGFFVVGAYAAGELSVPADVKASVLPKVFSIIGDHSVGNAASLVIAAAAGGIFAFLVGIPLMRLSGLAAGIRLDHAPGRPGEVEALKQLASAAPGLRPGQPRQLADHDQVGAPGQVVVQRRVVDIARKPGMAEQRVKLRGKDELAIDQRVKEWLLAGSITREKERSCPRIPQCERKHPP